MQKDKPYTVTAPEGKVRLLVMDATAGLPATFALLGTTAKKKVAIRLAGGCKGMNDSDKEQMLSYFQQAFSGYQGLIWSGATRQTNKTGEIDPMVTDVPGVIAEGNPGCVALGTVPRVDMMTLQGDSRLVLDKYGTAPNPSLLGILVVQNGSDGTLDWDGDVKAYAALMNQWRDCGGFESLGLISWNGGAVTKDEILMSIKQGWHTILVSGTGRATDELVAEIDGNQIEFGKKYNLPNDWETKTYVVRKDSPSELRETLVLNDFISK